MTRGFMGKALEALAYPQEQQPRKKVSALEKLTTAPKKPSLLQKAKKAAEAFGESAFGKAPEKRTEPFADLILQKASKYNLPPDVLFELVRRESGFNPKAKSPAGAMGLTQLTPNTAKALGVTNPYDPDQNLEGGAKYLRQQLDRFGSMEKALAAYNAGPGAVQKHGGVPPYKETQNYVKSILGKIGRVVEAAGEGAFGWVPEDVRKVHGAIKGIPPERLKKYAAPVEIPAGKKVTSGALKALAAIKGIPPERAGLTIPSAEQVAQLAGEMVPIGGLYGSVGKLAGRAIPKAATGLAARAGRIVAPGAAAGATYMGGEAALQGEPASKVAKEAAIGAVMFGGGDAALRALLKAGAAARQRPVLPQRPERTAQLKPGETVLSHLRRVASEGARPLGESGPPALKEADVARLAKDLGTTTEKAREILSRPEVGAPKYERIPDSDTRPVSPRSKEAIKPRPIEKTTEAQLPETEMPTKKTGVKVSVEAKPPETTKKTKAAPTETVAKDPWEMTRNEFGENYFLRGVMETPAYKGKMRDWGGQVEPALQALAGWESSSVRKYSSGPQGEILVYSKESIPYKDFMSPGVVPEGVKPILRLKGKIDPHRQIIQQALAEGKPIPPEVLKDYPDLAVKTEAEKPVSSKDVFKKHGISIKEYDHPEDMAYLIYAHGLPEGELGGLYDPKTKTLHLAKMRGERGHEIGHAIADALKIEIPDNLLTEGRKVAYGVSGRRFRSKEEVLAEIINAYLTNPEYLLNKSKNVYGWIEGTLKDNELAVAGKELAKPVPAAITEAAKAGEKIVPPVARKEFDIDTELRRAYKEIEDELVAKTGLEAGRGQDISAHEIAQRVAKNLNISLTQAKKAIAEHFASRAGELEKSGVYVGSASPEVKSISLTNEQKKALGRESIGSIRIGEPKVELPKKEIADKIRDIPKRGVSKEEFRQKILAEQEKRKLKELQAEAGKTQEDWEKILAAEGMGEEPAIVSWEALKERELAGGKRKRPDVYAEYTGTWDEKALDWLSSAEDAAKNRIRSRKGQLYGGIPADLLADYAIVGAVKIAKGAVKFSAWSEDMIREYGEQIKPHLEQIWNKSKEILTKGPEEAGIPIPKKMETLPSGEKVRSFPVTTIKSEMPKPETKAGVLAETKEGKRGVYKPVRLTEVDKEARSMVREDTEKAFQFVAQSDKPSALHTAVGIRLIEKFQKEGNFDRAIDTALVLSERLTSQGQAISAARIISNLSPEGVLVFAQRQINKINERLPAAAKKLKLTAEDAQNLKRLAENMQTATDKNAKTEAAMELQSVLQALNPSGILRKIATTQTIAQLLNPKTQVRNILGNEIFYRIERINKYVATPIDWAHTKLTGKPRTITFATGNQGGYWEGFLTGAKAGWKGVNVRGLETQYDLGKGLAFNPKGNIAEKTASFLERSLWATMRGFDYAAYNRAYNQTLGELVILRAKNEGRKVTKELIEQYMKEADANLLDIADQYGKFATFQDSNTISMGLVKLKRAMNLHKDFGVGDMLLKYPKTPGALIARGLEYSPAGFVRSAYQIAKAVLQKRGMVAGESDTRDILLNLSRAITGTLGITGLGYFLADKGIITGMAADDPDVKAMQKLVGTHPYRVNISALVRWAKSGFDPKVAELRPGDKLVSYDWALPISMALAMGANVAQKGMEAGVKGTPKTLTESVMAGVETVAEQPVLSGLKRFMTTYGSETAGESITRSLGEVAKDAPASFTPTILSQLRAAQDNTRRITYGRSDLEDAINKVKYKVPGLAKQLPVAYDVLGRKQEVYPGGATLFNVFLNPSFINEYQPTPEAELALNVWASMGETKQFPRQVKKYFMVEGHRIDLTPEEYSRLQMVVGKETRKRFARIPESISDERKVERMYKALNKAGQKGRLEILRARGIKAYKKGTGIKVRGGLPVDYSK